MSGFEVAGLVLAVLPFFIEAGKSYVDQARAFGQAVTPSNFDIELQEFYEEFYWDTFELQKNIEKIVLELPTLSEERKQEVLQSRDFDKLDQAKDVATALQDFLGAADYAAFQMVIEKMSDLFSRLIKDGTVHIKSHKNHEDILAKLKTLKKSRAEDKTTSRLWEGFSSNKKIARLA